MKVALDKTFPIPAGADAAWALLSDIEKLAGCMPGAAITERVDEKHFKGTVSVKFGPASMAFRGEVELAEITAASRTVHLIGKGVDSTGSSGASMDLTARIDAIDAASCQLVGHSEVSVSGKAAAFGGRMMTSVSDQVLQQFAANFAARIPKQASGPAAAAPTPGAAAPSGAPALALAGSAPAPATTLNGFALAWAIVRDWWRSLFTAKHP